MSNSTIKQEQVNDFGDSAPNKSLLIWDERVKRLEELGRWSPFLEELNDSVQDEQSYTGPQMAVLTNAIEAAERTADVATQVASRNVIEGSLVAKIMHQYTTEGWLSKKQLRVLERFLQR